MKERPILFSAPMVRAILNGSKTQTRRVVKPQPWLKGGWTHAKFIGGEIAYASEKQFTVSHPHVCIIGQPGDQLWVRETWGEVESRDGDKSIVYRADGWTDPTGHFKWKPSIHMPRYASRIQLEITNIRVERLQDCSESDAQAEGVRRIYPEGHRFDTGPNHFSLDIPGGSFNQPYAKDCYAFLWESINGPGSWDANPWVWVVEFRRLKP